MFLTVQVVSFATLGLVIWALWFFIFGLPFNFRATIYQIISETGILGANTFWLVYAVLSLIIIQQIIKAMLSVPLGSEAEPADVDFLFPAPVKAHVFFVSKYLRSIPRRLQFYFYVILALIPVIFFFMFVEFNLQLPSIIFFLLISFILGEIGSLATHSLYFLRKYVSQPRTFRRVFRFIFYITMIAGSILLLTPFLRLGEYWISSPVYNLALIFVGLGTQGQLAPLHFPALPYVILWFLILYVIVLFSGMWLSDKVEFDLYENIAAITHRSGTALGSLSQLPIEFTWAKTPARALLKKDIMSGIRKPGKTFYLVGIIANYVFALLFISFLPTLQFLFPIPPEFQALSPSLYLLLIAILVPLLAITAADPFHGEIETLYILRLAPLAPLQITFIKYSLLLVTPVLLSIPFAIYFAVIMGSLELLLIALAILPHAILVSTAIGVALGSRYPFATRAKTETPVALMVTYPVLSWIAMAPVVILLSGFLEGGIQYLWLGSLLIVPYTIGLVLILLSWAAHSYLRQE